jgi:hypothetical protein
MLPDAIAGSNSSMANLIKTTVFDTCKLDYQSRN